MNAKPLMTGLLVAVLVLAGSGLAACSSEGTLLRSYLEQPRRIGPLASTYVVIEEGDRSGGVSATFIVDWGGGPAHRAAAGGGRHDQRGQHAGGFVYQPGARAASVVTVLLPPFCYRRPAGLSTSRAGFS